VIDELIDEVADRPRTFVDDLDGWITKWGKDKRLICPVTGAENQRRVIDVSSGRGQIIMEEGPFAFATSELARPWLRRVHLQGARRRGMGKHRVPWRHDALPLLALRPPRYWGGSPREGDWAYIDINHAYAQLWEALTLDMYFRPEELCLGFGSMAFVGVSELLHFPSGKEIFHTAGGSIRSTRMTLVEHGNEVVRDTTGWSKVLAPDLWGIMMTQLQSIAHEMVRDFGAVMWHTDGGIVPQAKAEACMQHMTGAWDLQASVRASGPGVVYGPTRWQIGETRTLFKVNEATRREKPKWPSVAVTELVRAVRL
jgi:hypothetical protein